MSKSPFGSIEFAGKDIALMPVQYDRIAVGNRNELLLVSVVAPTQMVKAMRAILSGGAKATINATGGKVKKPSGHAWESPRQPGRLSADQEGYNCYAQKLEFGLAHAMFITRAPGFLTVVSPESLWRELNDPRYTTPILKAWMPYIEKKLRETDLLEEASSFNCTCGVLTATTADLDTIVQDGLKAGDIQIQA